MSAGVKAGGAYEGGPFWPVWSRGGAVEEIGGNVGYLVAEGLEEFFARSSTEPSR